MRCPRNLVSPGPDIIEAGYVAAETTGLAGNSQMIDHSEVCLRQGCYRRAGTRVCDRHQDIGVGVVAGGRRTPCGYGLDIDCTR
jgi:hypothetical protein